MGIKTDSALLLVVTFLAIVRVTGAADVADHVFLNGKIVTVDKRETVATAMAVGEGKIIYVGDDAGARALGNDTTQVIDLAGKTVLPGLIDSHTHPVSAAMIEFDHDIPEMLTIADVLAYVRERAKAVGTGKWIVIQQVFITRLEEKRYPTRDELDAAAPNNPVVFRTGPDASLNSLALTHFKIGDRTEAAEGSKIERDSTGTPTGILRGWNRIIKLPDTASRSPQQADRLARLKSLFKDYNANGITGIIDRDYLTCPVDAIRRIQVSEAWLAGRKVYTR
jgi:predicted amidohydrolase YtcJ